MTDISVFNFDDFVMLAGDKLVTDSRKVAKAFGKQHAHVLRSVRQIQSDLPGEFNRSNFGLVEYQDVKGEMRQEAQMTKDGFMLLVMGFTGPKAIARKVAYIKAFNAMADQLQRHDNNLWQQMQALIAKEVESKVRASFGSHLMNIRKKEIPPLRDTRYRLEQEIQPPLFLN